MDEPSNEKAVVTRTRIGFSIAILAIVCGIDYAALYYTHLNRNYLSIACSVLAALGLIGWLKGRSDRLNRETPEENPLRFLFQAEFLGIALILATGLSFGILYFRREKPPVVVVKAPPPPAPVLPKPKATFPPMKLTGVILNGARSSAIINSNTYFIGDLIGDAKVTEINNGKITVELEGEKRVVYLE